jgi:hypothetical protein
MLKNGKEVRSDDRWRIISEQIGLGQRWADLAMRNVRLARAAAWRAASEYRALYTEDQKFLLDMIHATHQGKTAVDDWLRDKFSFLKPLGTGEDVYSVLRGIESGQTRTEYLAKGPRIPKRETNPPPRAESLPVVPEEGDLSLLVKELRDQNKILRHEVAKLRTESETRGVRIAKLEGVIRRFRQAASLSQVV